MKSLLPYFVKLSKDSTMILKKYLSNCTVKRSETRPIIMIIHNEDTFFANNGYKKVWTLNSQGILRPKRREKWIIVLNFLL